MLQTAAGPDFVLEAGKHYQVSNAIARPLCAEQIKLDQPGTPEHGQIVKRRAAARIVERPGPKVKVHRLPAQPDPEDVPSRPDEDEITEAEEAEE